jgi:tRNA U34 5-methylaminomethyl-2-thiouridine-forming methyltransferase MnmC
MLFNHEQALLERETGIKYLLKHDLLDDLGLLYTLYLDEQERYLQPIAQAFRDHIFEQGQQLVARVDFSQEEHKEHTKIKEILSQTQLIEQVVAMLEKFQNMVRTCFKGNSYFERQRQAAFEGFLSKEGALEKDKVSMSEILAIYTDIILRKGGMKNL